MQQETSERQRQQNTREKRSFLKIALMFIFGFVIGWVLALLTEKYIGSFALSLPIVLGIVFGFLGSKKKEIAGMVSDEKLSSGEKTLVIIASILNPVIFGGVFYFVWHNRYPNKAKQSNHISIIIFLAELAAYAIYQASIGGLS